MIVFRADGNPQLGSGHIMRCLSLADAFRDAGQSSVFVTADSCFREIIQKRGYECVVLHTRYDHLEDELPKFIPFLQEFRPLCVLLDSYFVTPRYMAAVRRMASLTYIDDLNFFDYPADLVVNYTFYGDQFDYPQNKRYLLGPRYAVLRKEFQGLPGRRAAERVSDVLLSTGGADPGHIARACARYLCGHAPAGHITYHLVLGAMNQDADDIRHMAAGRPHILPHQNVSDMCSLMLQCGAAVSAGGTTLFELCACGLPTVTYVLADNQIRNAASFEEAGLMLNAGDVRGDSRMVPRIFGQLDGLLKNQLLRQQMADRMQALVDGRGAGRLAEAILEFAGSALVQGRSVMTV